MATRLGETQRKVLRFIYDYQQQYGESPTVREICDGLDLNTPSLVHHHLLKLVDKEYIRRRSNTARSIEIVRWDWMQPGERVAKTSRLVQFPIVGEIAAGLPIVAYNDGEEFCELPLSMAGDESCYALRVRGVSMIDRHICPGDLVIVRPQENAHDGDVVVALLPDNGVTLKTFFREKKSVRLQPANASMSPIYTADEDFRIQGVVRAVIRLAA